MEELRPLFYAGHIGDNEDTTEKKFQRARESLVDKGLVQVMDDIYSIREKGCTFSTISRTNRVPHSANVSDANPRNRKAANIRMIISIDLPQTNIIQKDVDSLMTAN